MRTVRPTDGRAGPGGTPVGGAISITSDDPSSLRVVFLGNFLAPNLVAVFRSAAARVASFRVLASVPMEPNRRWRPDDAGLDVVVQRTFTRTRRVEHPGGFVDEQYVHVPYDTFRQLRRALPDVVISHEMGARSVFASIFARRRGVAHVLTVFASERTEQSVGRRRRALRRWLARRADVVTCNGPSCRRYLANALGLDADAILPWDAAADPEKIHRGPIRPGRTDALRVLTVGQLVERKGVEAAAHAMARFAAARPEVAVVWTVVGSGPLEPLVRAAAETPNLTVELPGHLDPQQLRDRFAEHEVLLFPTLADEWGLVVVEAFGSGLAVLGSIHAQAVETLLVDGDHGFRFDPEVAGAVEAALERWAALSSDERLAVRTRARQSVLGRTPEAAADQLLAACTTAIARRTARVGR